MKRGIWCTLLLVLWAAAAPAQVKKSTQKGGKKPATTLVKKVASPAKNSSIQQLMSQGQYSAKKQYLVSNPTTPLPISDPTIVTFNQRACGAAVEFDNKSVIGVPKMVYGVGNGQILFRSRGATSSGTAMGNGAVGSGSGLGALGTNGVALGVNGKSPNAGPIMDGLIVTDLNNKPSTTPKNSRKTERKVKQ